MAKIRRRAVRAISVFSAITMAGLAITTAPPAQADPLPPLEAAQLRTIEVAFRSARGLSTDAALLDELETQPPSNSSMMEFGIPLTDLELADMHHRDAVAYAAGAVQSWAHATYPDSFAGMYLDQLNGGHLIVGFTDVDVQRDLLLTTLFPYADDRSVVQLPHSYSDLSALQASIMHDRPALSASGINVNATHIDQQANRVVVAVDGAADAVPSSSDTLALQQRYGNDRIRVESRPPHASAADWRRVVWHPFRAGTFVKSVPYPNTPGAQLTCTTGFNVHKAISGTIQYYQLTAAHCADSWHRVESGGHGYVLSTTWYQNYGSGPAPNPALDNNYYVIDDGSVAQFWYGGTADVVALRDGYQPDHAPIYYLDDSHMSQVVRGGLSGPWDDVAGSTVCHAGITTAVDNPASQGKVCGTLIAVDDFYTTTDDVDMEWMRLVDFGSGVSGIGAGDSGGPFFHNDIAYGLAEALDVCSLNGNRNCQFGDYSQIWNDLNALGLDGVDWVP